MIRRRDLLAGAAGASTLAFSGCLDVLGSSEDGGSGPLGRSVPAAAAIGEFGTELERREYRAYGIDVAHIRDRTESMSEDARRQFDVNIPVLLRLFHEDFGIDYADVDRMAIAGVETVNVFPVAVDTMGRLTQTVTLGDFDRDDVVEAFEEPPERSGHSLFENGERDDRGDVAVLSDGNVAAAVTDGVLVAGLEPAVRASIDAADGDAESYLDADPVRNDIVRKLGDPSFFSVGSHERREETDLEAGTFAGQVARGDGYRFTGDGAEAKIVRVFDDDDAIDVDAVETWADEALDRVPDLDARTEDRTVIVEGRADTDVLPFTTGAFLPFSYAAATVSR